MRRVPSYYDHDLPMQRFLIDAESLDWVPGKDSMEHAALTLWMHPRRSGMMRHTCTWTDPGHL